MNRRGFSLLEAIVVIAIVAVLVAILVPTLRSVWKSRSVVNDLSNLRQTMTDFFSYAAANRGAVANAGTPYEPRSRFYYRENWGTEGGWYRYIAQDREWPSVLAEQMTPGRHWHAADETWSLDVERPGTTGSADSRGITPELLAGWISRYELGDSMRFTSQSIAFPRATSAGGIDGVRDAATLVRFHDIRFPSNKGVLVQRHWWGDEQGLHHVAFADASVALRDVAQAQPTGVHPSSSDPTRRGKPVDCTLEGFAGLDW